MAQAAAHTATSAAPAQGGIVVLGGGRYATSLAYANRPEKARYIADKYRSILAGSVLDVGCDEAPLRDLVGDPVRYVGIDLYPGGADLTLDLDASSSSDAILPFPNASFDTVVCTDVLEHLERCHAVFDELCRVSASRVIVSLPNPLRAMVMGLFAGSAGKLKYYGLPAERPADRHRWFFGFDDAAAFVRERASANGFAIEQLDAEDEAGPYWRDGSGRDVLASRNIRYGTLWAVLRRGGGNAGGGEEGT